MNETAEYLKCENSFERKLMARFRCKNKESENAYWRKNKNRLCRFCKEKKETVEHMLKECTELRESGKERKDIMYKKNGWIRVDERSSESKEKSRKIFAFFVNFKAAFDLVDREREYGNT